MPVSRVSRFLLLTVLSLALLFAVLEPDPSRGMALPAALVFWVCHIGAGMLLAIGATALLARSMARISPWPRLLAGGVLGSLLFAPVAVGLEAVSPFAPPVEPPDGLLDRWELQGGWLALLAEWLQLAPSYLSSWLLINAAPLASAPSMQTSPGSPPGSIATDVESGVECGPTVRGDDMPLATSPAAAARSGSDAISADGSSFLRQLPPAVGSDVISIRSDLHYLQVRTALGRAIVLGSIATAEVALGAHGLRVHRSYWVALRHVRRVGRSGTGWYCLLSDGSRIPVSRRRAGAVRDRLGLDFVIDPG
jgi:hypothetical protein